MITMSEMNRRIYGDKRRRTLERKLTRRGIFGRDGMPTPRQIARGNFALRFNRSVCGRSGGVKVCVLVTEKGEKLIEEILRQEEE